MPTFNTNQPEESTTQEWTPLETGEYTMKIAGARIAPSPFANDDGEYREELTLTWELAEWQPDYEEAGYQRGQKVFQRMPPWYGVSKARGDSKFKTFIDQLRRENLIPEEFWIAGAEDADNQGDLIGIARRVMVEKYVKQQGKNAGQPGNRVLAIAPLKRQNTNPTRAAPPPSVPEAHEEPDLPWNPTSEPAGLLTGAEIAGMEVEGLRWNAQTIAQATNNTFWQKRDDWERLNDVQLRSAIRSMQSLIRRNANVDPNAELFPA